MRYMTGDELWKTLGWWVVLSIFAAAVGLTYMRTLDSSPFGYITTKTNATYDYVIVGGGASGCVLASRLSEDPRVSVLLLEAGGEETADMWNHVPLWNPIQPGTPSDWGYLTTPQKHACKASRNQQCTFQQAKILGGSSLTSSMFYSRGSRLDFTYWPSDGDRTWSWANVLPYFLKSEGMLDEDMKLSDYHSTNGPLTVSGPASEVSELHEMFKSGAQELKYKPIDCNGRESVGFCRLYSTVKDGERFSTAKDFLRPAMSRKNLHVSTHSIVIKVLISKSNAVGVEYVRNGQKRTVGATKEVILTAGTIGSAHLLMLSGIGPKETLTKLAIPLIVDLPVGWNLQEHLTYRMDIQTNESVGVTRENVFNAVSYLQYLTLGKGWLATNAGMFGYAQLKMDGTSTFKAADTQLSFSAISKSLNEDTKNEQSKPKHHSSPSANVTKITAGFSITVELLRPNSRGQVKLESSNPFTNPLINPNYLSNPKDIQTLIKGIKFALSFLSTSPFRSIKARLYDKPYSPCIQHRIKSDAYWECVLRHQAVGNGQATSTCLMGSPDNPESVVDTLLRVYNVTSLRVADASVMPSSVSGDISATKVMIGEKAVDIIRGHESVKFYRPLAEKVLKVT